MTLGTIWLRVPAALPPITATLERVYEGHPWLASPRLEATHPAMPLGVVSPQDRTPHRGTFGLRGGDTYIRESGSIFKCCGDQCTRRARISTMRALDVILAAVIIVAVVLFIVWQYASSHHHPVIALPRPPVYER